MKVHYYGHWYEHGASILLEPPPFAFCWTGAACYPLFTEVFFRALNSPTFLGCTFSGPRSAPRIWGRMQRGTEMGCCLYIRRLTHINLSLSSVPEIRVSLGDGTQGIAGICYNYHLLRIIIMCQILSSDKACTFY